MVAGNFLDDVGTIVKGAHKIMPFMGLGLKKKRTKKGGAVVAGNFLDDVGNIVKGATKLAPFLGFGLEKKRRTKKGGAVVAGNFLDDLGTIAKGAHKILPFMGLGIHDDVGKARKGGVMTSETYEAVRKALIKKVKAHMKKHPHGGDFWDDFSTGFAMPFQALASVL